MLLLNFHEDTHLRRIDLGFIILMQNIGIIIISKQSKDVRFIVSFYPLICNNSLDISNVVVEYLLNHGQPLITVIL
ncbi:hypothetical protein PROFFT_A_03940 [Candidatus Profftia tarda]|uniref:Uncharacterized protein n=1 Tax=Candidatus Profftia tarda TaxID=1177216 RepID=A0A8E4GI64_9ENTR|nr:hypothetical protein PROFFT_A_03940 [Candidatus Profftia tarda]